jgi:hypothetical protein
MVNYTPGPWIYDPGDRGDSSVGIGPAPPTVSAEAGDEIVEICRLSEPAYRVTPEGEYDEGLRYVGNLEFNARLIAAAPELLEALEELLLADSDMPSYESTVKKAKAAIRKATGQ